jgi:hypothetical protein
VVGWVEEKRVKKGRRRNRGSQKVKGRQLLDEGEKQFLISTLCVKS